MSVFSVAVGNLPIVPTVWLSYDETTSTGTAADVSGNGRNCTLIGSPVQGATTLLADGSGRSLTFDGVNDRGQINDDGAFDGMTSLSIFAVIKTSQNTGTPMICSRDDVGGGGFRSFQFRLSNGVLQFVWMPGGAVAIDSGVNVASNTIRTVGVRYNGTNVQCFVDGAPAGSAVAKSGSLGSSTLDLLVGSYKNGGTFPGLWVGSQDELLLFANGSLSDTDFANLHAAVFSTATALTGSGAGSRSARTATATGVATVTQYASSSASGSYRAGRTATATATVSAPVNVFRPSLTEELMIWDRPTGLCLRVSKGITLLLEDGAYRQVRDPSQVELEAADAYYLGGHRHEVSDATAAALTAAGYGDYLTTEQVVVRQ